MNAYTLAQVIVTLFNFYSTLVLVYCILSWFPMRPGGLLQDIGAVLESLVGPFLNLFRRLIPAVGGIDFSPVVAIIVLNLIERLLLNVLL